MRAVALLACSVVAAVAASRVVAAGNAPLHVSLPPRITARHAVTLVVRAGRAQTESTLRVVLVAPGASVADVVTALTEGGTTGRFVDLPRDGFAVSARRASATSWKVRLGFPRAGLWRVVVPNWTPTGYTTPFPALARVRVR